MTGKYKPPPMAIESPFCQELSAWTPYYPVGYPIQDGVHNPWTTVDPLSGATAFDVWQKMGRTTDAAAFCAKLAELRSQS